MAEITMLVTCAGGGLVAQLIRFLKTSSRHQVRVIAADMSSDHVARHFADDFVTVPGGEDGNYAEVVGELCTRHGIELIFPGADEETLALQRARSEFDTLGVTIACSDLPILELITNKLSTYRRLEELDVPMPVWRQASDLETLAQAIDEVLDECGQAVVKLPAERGGRGIFVINPDLKDIESRPGSYELHMNRDAFLCGAAREAVSGEDLLVMERLTDPVHDLDILAWHGEIKVAIPRRRHSSSAPNEGHVIVDAPELHKVGKTIVDELEMSWLFDIDVMMNSKGQPIILEVNPRASGSVAVGIAAGVPLMDDLISLAFGEPVEPREVPYGRRIFAYNALMSM